MPEAGFTLDGKPIKASFSLDYKSVRGHNFQWFERRAVVGADIKLTDGKGNIVQVNVREGGDGYRIELNGKTIAEG